MYNLTGVLVISANRFLVLHLSHITCYHIRYSKWSKVETEGSFKQCVKRRRWSSSRCRSSKRFPLFAHIAASNKHGHSSVPRYKTAIRQCLISISQFSFYLRIGKAVFAFPDAASAYINQCIMHLAHAGREETLEALKPFVDFAFGDDGKKQHQQMPRWRIMHHLLFDSWCP